MTFRGGIKVVRVLSRATQSAYAMPLTRALLFLLVLASVFSCRLTGAQAQDSGKRADVLRSFPLTNFYDTPVTLPAGKPGELIRKKEFIGYNLPFSVSAVRFVYRSRSAAGGEVAASGVVLFPEEKAPAGGWPVIAWAHGETGVARDCAPSLTRNLGHGPFLSMYVGLGYAVVATDYTGLGTDFRNAFADVSSNAADVIYSVPAARRAVPELGSRWIAMGTGIGAAAVVGVDEIERDSHDSNYLGSVAIEPLADIRDMYEAGANASAREDLYLIYGVKTLYPQFEVKDVLNEKAMPPYEKVSQNCGEAAAGWTEQAILKPNWKSNQFVQEYFDRNRVGLRPASEPLLVIGSEGDVPAKKIVSLLCQQRDHVQFESYPEESAGNIMGDSVRDQIQWIHERFTNGPVRNNCPR
jgi:hypothetical protein